jgi:hypothetical protein
MGGDRGPEEVEEKIYNGRISSPPNPIFGSPCLLDSRTASRKVTAVAKSGGE